MAMEAAVGKPPEEARRGERDKASRWTEFAKAEGIAFA
jgi:hypothetical protein